MTEHYDGFWHIPPEADISNFATATIEVIIAVFLGLLAIIISIQFYRISKQQTTNFFEIENRPKLECAEAFIGDYDVDDDKFLHPIDIFDKKNKIKKITKLVVCIRYENKGNSKAFIKKIDIRITPAPRKFGEEWAKPIISARTRDLHSKRITENSMNILSEKLPLDEFITENILKWDAIHLQIVTTYLSINETEYTSHTRRSYTHSQLVVE